MGGRRTSLTEEIRAVRARVERWRGEKEGWSRMPADLWEAATELARSQGVSPVSRKLGLDYTSLKKRVMEVSGNSAPPGTPGTPGKDGGEESEGFVDMGPAGLAGVFGSGGAEVEVREPDGTRLLVRLPEREGLNVAAVVGAFRGRRT